MKKKKMKGKRDGAIEHPNRRLHFYCEKQNTKINFRKRKKNHSHIAAFDGLRRARCYSAQCSASWLLGTMVMAEWTFCHWSSMVTGGGGLKEESPRGFAVRTV